MDICSSYFFMGIVAVPSREVWKEGTWSISYQPIWRVMNNHTINGFQTFFEIDLSRLVIQFIVVTIIMFILYITFGDSELNSYKKAD